MSTEILKQIIASGVGKRKTSTAKAYFSKGFGLLNINKKDFKEFFSIRTEELKVIQKPLILLNLLNDFNINIVVKGGGIFSQIDAIKLAICNGLIKLDKSYKMLLKKELLLKHDTRIKERRKYGLKKARKAPQYSKR